MSDFGVLYLYEITLLSNLQELFRTPLCVLYLYEITLLSNKNIFFAAHAAVLYLYEITLLSNCDVKEDNMGDVLYLYEITLLSNLKFCFHIRVNTRKKRLRAAGSESDKCNLYLYFRIRTDQCQ